MHEADRDRPLSTTRGVPLDEHDNAFAPLPGFRLAPPRIDTFLGMIEQPRPAHAPAPEARRTPLPPPALSPHVSELHLGVRAEPLGGLTIGPAVHHEPTEPQAPFPAVPAPPPSADAAPDGASTVWQLEPLVPFVDPIDTVLARTRARGGLPTNRRTHVEAAITYALIIACCCGLLAWVATHDDSTSSSASLPSSAAIAAAHQHAAETRLFAPRAMHAPRRR